MTEIERLQTEIRQARTTSDYWKAEHNAANKLIDRLRAALREIASIEPRSIEVQTDYGTDTYTTLVDDKAISIAREALENEEND